MVEIVVNGFEHFLPYFCCGRRHFETLQRQPFEWFRWTRSICTNSSDKRWKCFLVLAYASSCSLHDTFVHCERHNDSPECYLCCMLHFQFLTSFFLFSLLEKCFSMQHQMLWLVCTFPYTKTCSTKRISRCQNSEHFPLISFIFTSVTAPSQRSLNAFFKMRMNFANARRKEERLNHRVTVHCFHFDIVFREPKRDLFSTWMDFFCLGQRIFLMNYFVFSCSENAQEFINNKRD